LLLALAASAWAHKGSDAYLDVRDVEPLSHAGPATSGGPLRFSYAVAIKDLDLAVPLDADADGKVTWGELKAAMPAVQQLLQAATGLDAGAGSDAAACRLLWTFDGLEKRSDGGYMRWTSDAACAGAVGFRYSLFRAQDATHRLLVTGRIGGQDLLSTWSPQQPGALVLRAPGAGGVAAPASADGHTGLQTLWAYLVVGVHHLLEGYDHLAFLLALVLPLHLAIRGRRGGGCRRGPRHLDRAAAHHHRIHGSRWAIRPRRPGSTLVLATLGLTEASPAWVEPAIALSIGVTALHNLYPVRHVRTDVLALVFGMVHGFGFASLLTEAAAPSGLLPWALAGFNLGVECGQLLVVAGWVLLSQVVQRQPWYGRVVMRGGSWLLLVLAGYWFWQRVG
jgi:hydrogenase/urease accessory protein HupE